MKKIRESNTQIKQKKKKKEKLSKIPTNPKVISR